MNRPIVRTVVLLLGILLVVLGIVGWSRFSTQEPDREPTGRAPGAGADPLRSLENSDWRNTAADVKYVGTEVCAGCHQPQLESYRHTAHSSAMQRIDIEQEPADATFTHAASGRQYQIYRQGSELRHREYVSDDEGKVIVQTDHAMDWLIGSGRHSRSYLVRSQGYLVESPVTWYTARQAWDVSPGYDHPDHWGFERPIDRGCLYCHVGSTDPVRDGFQTVSLVEPAIGCERCHGPGSLHVARWESLDRLQAQLEGEPDRTIVNPSHLDRRLAEDVCAQCHVRGDATVTRRGRDLTDYRPGLPLSAVRVDYHLQIENRPMEVVGHVEQMRLSRCYEQSETLTCTTCHDPHNPLTGEAAEAMYRRKCLDCHASGACGLPEQDERRQSVSDRCVSCHMPQVPTDIPHIAFTHHRIGLHDANKDSSANRPGSKLPRLIPDDKPTNLLEWERKRSLGLAYLEIAGRATGPLARTTYHSAARELLEECRSLGLADGEVDAGLAQVLWEKDPELAEGLAAKALEQTNTSDTARVNALFLLGEIQLHDDRYAEAAEHFQELSKLRRHSEDHFLQGLCWWNLGEIDKALVAAKEAVAINPFRADVHRLLSDLYEEQGADEEAARHRRIFAQLEKQKTLTSGARR